MKINPQRLTASMEALAAFGQSTGGGIHRSLGSQADLDARAWLRAEAQASGLEIRVDAVANIWLSYVPEGTEGIAPLTLGSHHDAVPAGGRFDGAMGVLLGLEVLRSLRDQRIPLNHPVQVVSFTAEEPNPFHISTMGSRSVSGKLTQPELSAAVHAGNGQTLTDALQLAGGNLEELEISQLRPGDMAAFIECHIEQGRNLDDAGIALGVVSVITGIYREQILIAGEANHAGTTRMEHRHDALLAAAEAALAVERIASGFCQPDVVATVGKLDVSPNSANIIPGQADMIIEFRMPDAQTRDTMRGMLDAALSGIARRRGVLFSRRVILDQPAAVMDPGVMKILCAEAGKTQPEVPVLTSMAGHDTVHMTHLAPSAMLFVRSIGGKSHCAEEKTLDDDMIRAGDVLLRAIVALDKEFA